MTNQNNELDKLFDKHKPTGNSLGHFDELKKDIQALYAPKPVENGELREQLAAIEHERWSDWQSYCHIVLRGNNPSPEQGDILERWDRQIETPYAELSEKEKQSDRDQVDRYWQLVEAYVAQEKTKWVVTALEAIPKNYPHQLGADVAHLWDSPDATDGYNQACQDVRQALAKLLDKKGGENE